MNITTKMTVYTTCILALVLGLLLTMNYFKFGNILTDVTTSRLAVINKNLEFSLSRATNLGLALEELQFADTLLKRAKESDPAIRNIQVFDVSGKILFSTGESAEGGKVDENIMGLIKSFRKKESNADLRGADLSGADLSYARLLGADLRKAKLNGATLYGTNMKEANFERAILKGARIASVVRTGTNFCRAIMPDGKRGKCPKK